MSTASPLEACSLHKRHSPGNLTVELHHVIPVAWQLTWQPQIAPYPGRDIDGRGMLWDARTVPICPTGHRNTHHWLVALMRALTGEDPAQTVAAVAAANRLARGPQLVCASEALTRFKAVGGSLQQLVAAGEWGMA